MAHINNSNIPHINNPYIPRKGFSYFSYFIADFEDKLLLLYYLSVIFIFILAR